LKVDLASDFLIRVSIVILEGWRGLVTVRLLSIVLMQRILVTIFLAKILLILKSRGIFIIAVAINVWAS
jgi:hypothetical protein